MYLCPIVRSIGSVTYDMLKLWHLFYNRYLVIQKNVQNSFAFVLKIKGITPKPEETIISYDVVGLFTNIPPSSAIDVVHLALLKDTTPSNQTNLS